jgi:hypothetical protein
VVALHALDRRVDDFDRGAVLLEDTFADAVDGRLASVGVADNAALADVGATGLELRLDENDGGAFPGVGQRAERRENRRQNERGGDEGDVHGEEGSGWLRWHEEFAEGEEARVGALAEGDAGIIAERLGDLAVASIYSKDSGGAVLQHTVGEAAGGGADIDAGEAGEVDGPVGEGVLQLEAAAADVLEVGAEETDDCVGGDGGAGLVDALLVDKDTACEDEGLSALAGGGVAVVDEEFVETDFFVSLFCGIRHSSDWSAAELGGPASIFSW